MNWAVIYYAANIIDYMRLILLLASVFFKGTTFAVLYSISVALDFFDGQVARAKGEVSVLGATLDMIIDRVSTMVILTKIALEKPNLSISCMLYSVIDLVSHFLFFLVSAYTGVSHKSMTSNVLLAFYYDIRVLRFVCLGSELCFLVTYLTKSKGNNIVRGLQSIAALKTFFHVAHFFVAVGKLSDIPGLSPK